MQNFMFIASCMATVLCLPMILLFRQRPTIFPSASAQEDALNSKKLSIVDLWKDIVELATNRNFRIVFFIFAIMNGSVICLGAIINFLLEGCGFNNVQISIMSATFVFVCVCVCLFVCLLVCYRALRAFVTVAGWGRFL